jgi:hypothetical protein
MLRLFVFIIFLNINKLASDPIVCPLGAISYQGQCYWLNANPMTFIDAQITCRSANGKLVSIHDAFTNSFLGQEAWQTFSSSTDCWIGATTRTKPGTWSWLDNSEFKYADWKNTSFSEPKKDQCAALTMANNYWIGDDCTKTKPFICQDYTPTFGCPDKWTFYEPTQSCYFLTPSLTWTAAEAFCLNYTSHLSSILSVDEIVFSNKILKGNKWIGLYSFDNQRTWRWADGTFFNFTKWDSDNPQQMEASCVSSFNYFTNGDCSASLPGLCKKPFLSVGL